MLRPAFLASLLALPTPGIAAPLTVYDDALRNGFEDWSWNPGDVNFDADFHVHTGTHTIFFKGYDWNAVSLHRSPALNTSQYKTLRFFIKGDGGGEQLHVTLQNGDSVLYTGALNPFIAGGSVSNLAYREVLVPLTQAPVSINGAFDRISIQSAAGTAANQQWVYIDDISLLDGSGNPPAPVLFADGFEAGGPPPGTAVPAIQVDRNVNVAAMTSDRFTWRDSANRPRSAVLAHNSGQNGPQAPGGYPNRGGALRQFSYQLADGTTRTANVTASGNAGQGGFGYVVSHAGSTDHCTSGDDSPLGYAFSGNFARVFEGRHHVIFRFTQNYPRYCTTATPAQNHAMPVTIEWQFSTGRDHPLWSVTYDVSAIAANRLNDDSRGPYGELLFDGAASEGAHAQIAGVAWGDRYKFTTTTAPVTTASAWTWNQPNTIPYVKLWTTAPDATMGIVQNRTIVQQDAGGYWGVNRWNSTSAAGAGCASPAQTMPCPWNWPYQAIAWSIGANPTRNTRLAWGTNAGFLGQTSYYTHGSAYYGGPLPNTTAPGRPYKSYSTYIVLGPHSAAPVEAQVAQIERIQSLNLTANVGSVAANGPSGVADATPTTYQPAGYDPVRGALAFNAASNRLDANIAVGAGTLAIPLVILRNYTGSATPQVRLGDTVLTADVDYFASKRTSPNELWITLNRNLSGAANRLRVDQ